jgi:predicted P-loop ATPase
MKGQMLSDSDVVETRLFLSRREKYEPTGHLMFESMISCAKANAFHPVRDYLENLSWDGVKRIDSWLHNYFGAEDNSYTQAVGRKLLVAAIARVMKPGCKFDHVVILEGKQGIGKSTALRVLSEPWFCDSLGDVTNKDVIQQIQGSWIVEIGELASMDRASVNALKDFVSKQEDKARLAYQRLAQKFPRQCILIGTTNDEEYLKDLTGNRRFWPVEVEKTHQIEMEALALDRDMLWAEALVLYKKGSENLWLDDAKVKAKAEQIQRSKMVSDPWDEVIQKGLKMDQKNSDTADTSKVTTMQIWREIMGRSESSITKGDQMRLAGSLKRLGFHRRKLHRDVVWERI